MLVAMARTRRFPLSGPPSHHPMTMERTTKRSRARTSCPPRLLMASLFIAAVTRAVATKEMLETMSITLPIAAAPFSDRPRIINPTVSGIRRNRRTNMILILRKGRFIPICRGRRTLTRMGVNTMDRRLRTKNTRARKSQISLHLVGELDGPEPARRRARSARASFVPGDSGKVRIRR